MSGGGQTISQGYTVSGTVTDPDGSALENASLEVTYDTNDTVVTTATTNASATTNYGLSLANGTYDIEASKAGYLNTTKTVTVSGSAVTMDFSLGGAIRVTDQNGDPVANATLKVYGINQSAFQYATQQELDRKMANLNENLSDPIPPDWDPDRDITGLDGPFQEHYGENYTIAVAHPRGAYGPFADIGPGERVSTTRFDGVALKNGHTLTPQAGSDLVISLWNLESAGREINALQDDINDKLPGKQTTGHVTVERLDAGGAAIESSTFGTSFFVTTSEGTLPGVGDIATTRHEAVVLRDVQPGIYRIYPKGNSSRAIVYAVAPDGDVSKLESEIKEGLKRENETLTARAQALQDAIEANKVENYTVTTGPDGTAALPDLPSNVNSVMVQAYKAPDGMDADPQSVDHEDITNFVDTEIDAYQTDLENMETTADLDTTSAVADLCRLAENEPASGALTDRIGKAYSPSAPTRIDVPAERRTKLQVVAVDPGEYADIENSQCYGFRLQNYLASNNFTDTLSWLQQRADTLSRDELEGVYAAAIDAAEGSAYACRKLADRTGIDPAGECDGGYSDDNGDGYVGTVDGGSGGGVGTGGVTIPTTNSTIEDTARGTLENVTGDMSTVIDGSGASSDAITAGDTRVEDGELYKTWDVSKDLRTAHVQVELDWSNGSTTLLTRQSEYIEVFADGNPAFDDEVQLLGYPIGEQDPPALSTTIVVVGADDSLTGDEGTDTPDSIDRETSGMIRNPTFSGSIPDIDAVRVSTLRPGPDERVQLGLRPAEESTYGTLEAVRVTGPNGQSLNTSSITNGRNIAFTTNGQGEHHIEMTYSNADGANFTKVVRLRAGPVGHELPPTIRAKEGPTGTFAVVAAYESGQIDVESGGATIEAVGILGANADVPAQTSIHTVGITRPNDATNRFRLVRAPNQQAVSRSITTRWHMRPLTAESTLYRHGDSKNAVPLDGGNQFASVDRNGSLTVVSTYTTGDGDVAIRSVAAPGRWDAFNHWLDLQLQGVPVIGGFVTAPAPVAGLMTSLPFVGLALVFNRRWSR